MEGRVIKISDFSTSLTLQEYQTVKISNNLKYLYVLTKDGHVCLYAISRSYEPSKGPIWNNNDVHSFIFSEDGNEFMLITNSKSFQNFKLQDMEVHFVQEKSQEEMSEALEKFDIKFAGSSDVILYKFSQQNVVLFLNKMLLVTLRWCTEDIVSIQNKIEVTSCVTIVVGHNALYTLTSGGNVTAYDPLDGQQKGVIHLYALVPPEQAMDVLSFKHMTISSDSKLLAVSDRASQVFVVQTKSLIQSDNLEQQRWDCGTSVKSFGSDFSAATNLSHAQSKISADTMSLSPSTVRELGVASPGSISWNSFLHSLQRKPAITSEESPSEDLYSCMHRVLGPPPGLMVQALHLSPGELSVWYTEPGTQTGGVYHLHDLTTGSHVEEQVPSGAVVIPGGLLGLKDAFLLPGGLWLFLGELSRDALVSKLLHCMQTESVGRLLQGGVWADLVVPPPAVARALQQHHLDVAHLALSLHVHGLETNFSSFAWEDENQNEKLKKLMNDLDDLLGVICRAAGDFLKKPTLCEELVLSTLEQTNHLLEFLSRIHHPVAKEMTCKVMVHVVQIRRYLLIQPSQHIELPCEYQEDISPVWQRWQSMSEEEVIQDSVLNNNMPHAQAFLLKVRSWPLDSFQSKLQSFVMSWVDTLLEKSLVSTAEEVLWRVGKDPGKELLHICVNTEVRKLRDLLSLYLLEKDSLPPEENGALVFLQKVEQVLNAVDVSRLRGEEVDVAESFSSEFKGGAYSIAAVLKKTEDWRQHVLISLFFNVPGAGKLQEEIKPELVWDFLLVHNREDILSAWITQQFSTNSDTVVLEDVQRWANRLKAIPISPHCSAHVLSAEDIMNIFAQWPISQDMVDSVITANSMTVTREKVLNHLSRFGIFTSAEKVDAGSVLRRIILAGNMENMEEILSQSTGNITFQDFQVLLTRRILDNDLHDIAFPCLEGFNYTDEQLQVLQKSNGDKGWDWFLLWLVFQEIQKNPEDEQAVYNCILKSAEYLSEGNLTEYLKQHPLVVMSLLLYSGQPLAEVFSSEQGLPDVNAEVLSATLKRYPLLAKAIERLKNPNDEKPDITVYQLLEGNAPFDTSKLFGWQEDHKIEGEELPHFSSPKLVEKYGVEYKMSYLIYLKLARPCFAACKFVIDQYKNHATLSQKRVKYACKLAYQLALENYEDMEITGSCIAFTEIMGEESLYLKVDIAAARKIHAYLQQKEGHGDNRPSEIVGEMLAGLSLRDSPTAPKLLSLLEKALSWELSLEKSLSPGSRAAKAVTEWSLAVKFARAHTLKLPEVFMKQLTSENNWLQFILTADIYKYPLEQVKELAQSFKSEVLQEHMFHLLQVEIPECKLDDNQSACPETRRPSLSKTLPRKISSKQEHVSSAFPKQKKFTKHKKEQIQESDIAHQLMEITDSVLRGDRRAHLKEHDLAAFKVWKGDHKKDLLLVLLECHLTLNPSKHLLEASLRLHNPVYAVLAMSYDQSIVIPGFCSWLLASLPQDSFDKMNKELSIPIKEQSWNEEDVMRILEEAVSLRFIRTLQLGCFIFFPDNPLRSLMDFLFEAIIQKNFKESILKVKLFKAAFLNLKNAESSEESFINDSYWLGNMCVRLVKTALFQSFANLHFELQFLEVLLQGKFMEHIPANQVPDFELLLRLVKCFPVTGVFPDLKALSCPASSSVYQQEVTRCLQELLQRKQYNAALRLTAVAGLNKDSVLLAQWHNKFDESRAKARSLARDDLYFWKKCNEAFSREKVHPHAAAKFFQEHAYVELLSERYHVFQLAVHWLKVAMEDLEVEDPEALEKELASVEFHMWNCWLESGDSECLPLFLENCEPELLYVTKYRILELAGITYVMSMDVPNDDKSEKVKCLLGKLLDGGDLVSACRVEAMYSIKDQDLRILLLCLDLAEGEISPYELTTQQRMLFSETSNTRKMSHRRRALVSTISNMAHSPGTNNLLVDYVEIPPRDRQDTLNALEKLTGRIKHGANMGNRVVMCYRIAMNLNMNYQDVLVLRDPLVLLKTALADDCLNKFIVASDLITAGNISGEEVAEFLAEEILTAIKRSKLKGEVSGTAMWGVDLDSSFHLVLDVCIDQAALGRKLLTMATETTSAPLQNFYEVHVIAVELVICAHNSFVAALDMEGIGSVLKMCQTLTSRLTTRQEWALMVRLLTGVGRYTEMRYIFQKLYENEQFEYLLGKGLDKVKGLQQAVVDFLRMYCPDDRKLQEMVALRFSMFKELAIFQESDGLQEEEALIKLCVKGSSDGASTLPVTEDVTRHLHQAMNCFKNAAEFFLQDEKLIKATKLAHHAELFALQTYFVNTAAAGQHAPLLLKLGSNEIKNLINHQLNFPQACIIARAYEHLVDWGAALYHHCVLKGDEVYFSHFTASMPLTASVVEDVARRFQVNRNVTAENIKMMKRFVQQVNILDVKYRLASQLGFRDIAESMINMSDVDVAFLKDTVFQHGFRR